MSDYYLSDADYEEEVRCAALGFEGPNAKTYRAMTWAGMADILHKREKENPSRNAFRCDDPEKAWIEDQEAEAREREADA